MFFKKRKPKRLYVATKSKWYNKPRRKNKIYNPRKVFTKGLRNNFSRFVKDAFMYLVAGGVLLGLLIFFLFSNRFSISSIEVSRDNLYVDNAAVMLLLKPYEGQSIFTFSKTEAQVLIQDAYPEFEEVTVRKFLPDKIKVELKSHEIVANIKAIYFSQDLLNEPKIIEEETPLDENESPADEASGEDAVVIDENLAEAFELESDLNTDNQDITEETTPIEQKALLNSKGQAILDQEESLELMTITIEGLKTPIQDREFVIPSEHVLYITDAIKYLTNLTEMKVNKATYFTMGREVHLITENNLVIWLVMNDDTPTNYKEQIDKLDLAFKNIGLNESELAYVDLRVPEKLIFCRKGNACDVNE